MQLLVLSYAYPGALRDVAVTDEEIVVALQPAGGYLDLSGAGGGVFIRNRFRRCTVECLLHGRRLVIRAHLPGTGCLYGLPWRGGGSHVPGSDDSGGLGASRRSRPRGCAMSVRLLAVCALFWLAVGSATAQQPHVWPWYGMYIRPIRDAHGRRVLYVEKVVKDGPAARAGIRVEDLVTAIGSLPVDFGDEYELLSWLSKQKPGTRLPIVLIRTGRAMTVVLSVGTLPDSARGSWERALSAAFRARAMRQEAPPRP